MYQLIGKVGDENVHKEMPSLLQGYAQGTNRNEAYPLRLTKLKSFTFTCKKSRLHTFFPQINSLQSIPHRLGYSLPGVLKWPTPCKTVK